MATNPAQAAASAGQSAGRAAGQALGSAGELVGKAATRTREQAEDMWAEAKDVARREQGRDAAVYTGIAATAVLGAVELPVAAALGAGYALIRRRR